MAFFALFIVMASWEYFRPARSLNQTRSVRWFHNLSLVLVSSLLVRWCFPVAAVGIALFAEQNQWGVLNVLMWPLWLELVVSLVLLDLLIYFQHRMVHAVPWLWRIHRVHHADMDYDVTTGLRFHPLEILLSMAIKMLAVGLLGCPPMAVVIFEVLLNGTSMFNHGNVRLPAGLESVVRKVLVTPDMHRIHHSTDLRESNSNFGFSFSGWDRLFGTYLAQPKLGQKGMVFGLKGLRSKHWTVWLPGLILLPFVRQIEEDDQGN